VVNLNIVYIGQNDKLVFGNSHLQGGILLIQPEFNREIFIYAGEMEGWEYLTSPLKSIEILNDFMRINNLVKGEIKHKLTEFDIPQNCKVIKTLNNTWH
jgi:hypothetical protein